MTVSKLPALYPLLFETENVPRIWGGANLGRPVEGVPLGERWLLSSLPEKETPVANGLLAGTRPSELAERYGATLLGKEGSWVNIPLVKWIDTRLPLSIQVHPNDEMARRMGEPHGKTEMWYCLTSAPEAKIYVDTRKHLSQEELREVIETHQLEDALGVYTPRYGDIIYVPGGVLHSIGGGIQLIEIQQPSDTTYRLYDWERTDANGQKRPLQLELAYQAYDPKARVKIVPVGEGRTDAPMRLQEPPFTVANYELEPTQPQRFTQSGGCRFYLALQPVTLGWTAPEGGEHQMLLPAMRPVLIPAILPSYAFCAEQERTLLLEFSMGL